MRKPSRKVKSQVLLLLYGMTGVTLKELYQQNEVPLKILSFVIINQMLCEERKEKKPNSAKANPSREGVLAVSKILQQENRHKI